MQSVRRFARLFAFVCLLSAGLALSLPAAAAERRAVITEGADYFGEDIETLKGVDLGDCEAACVADQRCLAFTYNTKAQWCFKKSTVGDLRVFAGAVAGKIVVCERGGIGRVQKGYNALQGGAIGLILYNPMLMDTETDNHFLPAIHLEGPNDALLAFLAAGMAGSGAFPFFAAAVLCREATIVSMLSVIWPRALDRKELRRAGLGAILVALPIAAGGTFAS